LLAVETDHAVDRRWRCWDWADAIVSRNADRSGAGLVDRRPSARPTSAGRTTIQIVQRCRRRRVPVRERSVRLHQHSWQRPASLRSQTRNSKNTRSKRPGPSRSRAPARHAEPSGVSWSKARCPELMHPGLRARRLSNDEWLVQRRYLSVESVPPIPAALARLARAARRDAEGGAQCHRRPSPQPAN